MSKLTKQEHELIDNWIELISTVQALATPKMTSAIVDVDLSDKFNLAHLYEMLGFAILAAKKARMPGVEEELDAIRDQVGRSILTTIALGGSQ